MAPPSSGANPELAPIRLPAFETFSGVCRQGFSAVWDIRTCELPDTQGWMFGSGWPPSYWAYGRMRTLLAMETVSALRPTSALEVASAGGALSAWMAQGGCRVIANDLRREELDEWLPRFGGGEKVRVEAGNLFDLDPRALGQVDLVIALEVLEHVAHTVDFLRHLARFVRPGGHLFITTPNGLFFRNKLPTHSQVRDFTALEKEQFKPDADGHLFLLTPAEFSQLGAEAGLRLQSLSVWGTPMLTGNCKFSVLSHRSLTRAGYLAEKAAQRLPAGLRTRVCTAMSAIFTLETAR
jgi:2-polyprenyl-6-hydroxyphenyl methylase/3-demethylubiquinone-9 3-methyltransferase